MRLDFNYIIVDDDLKSSRNRRRVEKIQKIVDTKIISKGLNPKPNLYKSLDEFYEDEENLDSNRFDLYLSDNNLGNSGKNPDSKHANDGIQLYLDLHSRFPCDFILYTGSTQDQIIEELVSYLKETKDPGLFSRFTFVSRSSDPNDNWHKRIEDVIDLIISSREEMNTMRGLYAQLTSQIHSYINKELNIDRTFKRSIESLNSSIINYNTLDASDINCLHRIRHIRNGLMHNDERKCPDRPHTYYLVYYEDDAKTIEKRMYLEDFDSTRQELRDMYKKICVAFGISS